MKRPIAELLIMTLNAGAEAERAHVEHEAWQILRRKQGYVTHRIYQLVSDPLQRLVYSEWEGSKAVDGARQRLQGTPLMRRARALLAAPPERLVLELAGPITSTKGLDLPEGAVAASAVAHLKGAADGWRELEQQFWKTLASQPGHITHVIFRGVSDGQMVGSFSHWGDAETFKKGLSQIAPSIVAGINAVVTGAQEYTIYKPVRD